MNQPLSDATLPGLPAAIARPGPRPMTTRVVHFGPGAFHRAHQAFYFDRMDLGITAVSLHSRDVRDALAPQDGLYTLVERGGGMRVIGSLREVLVAPEDPEAVLARLASPEVTLVTATVTEKGYREAGPGTFVGYLVEGLRRRRAAGTLPFVTLSCDNLSDNGGRLRAAVLAAADPDLAAWIAAEAAFPSTMVDSITPATDEALRAEVEAVLGLRDAWPVQREVFTDWVVEDAPGLPAAAMAAAGVMIAKDVAPFERAKLRLLNGAHSTLAYVGLGLGYETVSQAMADARLADFVERMMRQDVAPLLGKTPGLDLAAYVTAILGRFRNPAIVHRLSQIAWDGSQKLPFRVLETVGEALAAGRSVERLAVPVGAWMQFVVRAAREGREIVDPLAGELLAIGNAAGLLAMRAVFPERIANAPAFRAAVERAFNDPVAGLDR